MNELRKRLEREAQEADKFLESLTKSADDTPHKEVEDMNAIIQDGIQYVLPGIFKAYRRDWAEEFLRDGTIYFTNLKEFRTNEHSERGDCQEGTGITIRQGQRCTTNPLNPIFVCCFTMETDLSVILDTWKDRDTIVQICNTICFAKRIRDAALEIKEICFIQIGPVTYDKDEGSRRAYYWGENIFQKNLRFSDQKEFRFALIGECCIQTEKEIVLRLGDCTDIALIL